MVDFLICHSPGFWMEETPKHRELPIQQCLTVSDDTFIDDCPRQGQVECRLGLACASRCGAKELQAIATLAARSLAHGECKIVDGAPKLIGELPIVGPNP